MATTDWSMLAPLGAKTHRNYTGDLRVTIYPIDTTETFLDEWFNHASIDCEPIENVIIDTIKEHKEDFGISKCSAQEEAISYDQTFQNAYNY